MNSHVVASPLDEARLAEQLSDADYFCQEGIFGQSEYTAHVVCSRGRIVRATTIEFFFEREVYIKGREADCGRALCECPYLDLFGQILGSIGLEGFVVSTTRFRTGNRIFEINPRFGASLAPLFAEFIDYLTPSQAG